MSSVDKEVRKGNILPAFIGFSFEELQELLEDDEHSDMYKDLTILDRIKEGYLETKNKLALGTWIFHKSNKY